jgi:uncharacterized protein YfaT (DUF1175 family)
MTPHNSSHIANPDAYFSQWFFTIGRHQRECVGVNYRKFVKNKIPTWAWAETNPPEYILSQGYIFYEANNPNRYLQLGTSPKNDRVEVHIGTVGTPDRTGFVVHTHELIQWLKTGRQPQDAKPIDFAMSMAGLMAWQFQNLA